MEGKRPEKGKETKMEEGEKKDQTRNRIENKEMEKAKVNRREKSGGRGGGEEEGGRTKVEEFTG